jgi:hypothetical protein
LRIVTEAACRTAVAAAGKIPSASSSFVEGYAFVPRGCYYTSTNSAYFNTDPVGAGKAGTRLLCAAVATTGAPLPHCDRIARCNGRNEFYHRCQI